MEHMSFFHNQEVVGQRQKLQNVMPSFLSALFEIKGERRRKEERKKEDGAQRSGSVVQSTGYSVRRPTFDSQHPQAGSQWDL